MGLLSDFKNLRFFLKLLAYLGILLLIITIGQSYLEYRSSQKAILELFRNQSEILITSIARAGEKGLIAYQSLQEQMVSSLFALTQTFNTLNNDKGLAISEAARAVADNHITELIMFDDQAKPVFIHTDNSAGKPDSIFPGAAIIAFINSDEDSTLLGIIDGLTGDGKVLAVLRRDVKGKIIFAGMNATMLQNRRRAFSTGSVIEDLSQSSGVKYAGILNDNLIIAATRNFPVDQVDDWYNPDGIEKDSICTRLKQINTGNDGPESVFEARGPFNVAGQYYGDIVLGLETKVLDMLQSKLKRDVFWHSILGLLITLIAVSGIVIWNNYQMISKRYDQIQAEVQKLEADKAIKARLASMGELAAGVAHEIRNPLNAIRVIIQRFQREFIPQSDRSEYIELTHLVKRETDRINETIEHFLKMARPPSLNKAKANFNDCLENILELFSSRANQKNIFIEKKFSPLPDTKFDSKLCGQAILNILENALDALKEKGLIIVRTYSRDGNIYIEIIDNGPGISDDLKGRIFDMYFTTKDSGTGMGLPAVLMTVKEHGGRIEILDNPTGGAIFRLEFPIEQ